MKTLSICYESDGLYSLILTPLINISELEEPRCRRILTRHDGPVKLWIVKFVSDINKFI